MTEPQGPFTSLIESNAIPLDSEVLAIKQYIIECQKESTALDEALEKLQKKRNALRNTVDRHLGLIHPLRCNPDLLQEIFFHCLPTEHDALISPKEAPILLTRVCHHWRNLALATPRLWASIHIPIPCAPRAMTLLDADPSPPPDSRRDALLQVVTAWLSRSGTCPLSISIYNPKSRDDTNKDSLPFLETVIQYSSRWRKLILSGDDAALAKFDELEVSQVPMLEEVTLSIYSMGLQQMQQMQQGLPSSHSAWSQFGILKAPTIRKLKLTVKPNAIPLVWNNLLHISIGIASSTQMDSLDSLEILRLCPNLTKARFQIQHSTPVHDHPPPFTSPRLKQLSLHFFRSEPGHAVFFDTLRAPALRDLSIHGYEPPTEVDLEPFLKFIRRVNSLHHLCISPRFESERLEALLRLCPDLVTIKTKGGNMFIMGRQQVSQPMGVNESVLRGLYPSEPGQLYVCPKLTTLEVDNANFPLDVLVEFVLARERIATSSNGELPEVKHLKIVYNARFEDSVMQKLPKALQSGICLQRPPIRDLYGCRQGLQMWRSY